MAQLTKAQWEKKLKNLVPSWHFTNPDGIQSAMFKGMAAVMASAQAQYIDKIRQTTILLSDEAYVGLHGLERSIDRLPNEPLASYRSRVQKIINKSNLPAIKALVDGMLINGTCVIIEHYNRNNFFDRDAYFNRLVIDFEVLYNAFTIMIADQTPSPETFCDRNFFLNQSYFGSGVNNTEVFENIIQAVNKNKAYGTVYRLIERAPT